MGTCDACSECGQWPYSVESIWCADVSCEPLWWMTVPPAPNSWECINTLYLDYIYSLTSLFQSLASPSSLFNGPLSPVRAVCMHTKERSLDSALGAGTLGPSSMPQSLVRWNIVVAVMCMAGCVVTSCSSAQWTLIVFPPSPAMWAWECPVWQKTKSIRTTTPN